MEIASRECYVIRIYRRDDEDPEKIRGLVELVGSEEQKTFASFSDLRNILLSLKGKGRKSP